MKPTFLYFNTLTAWAGYGPAPRPQAIPGTHAPAFVHPPKPHPARPAWPYPSRSVLGIVLLFGLSLAAAAWNAHTQLPPTLPAQGIDLRAESAGPKVNTTSAEPPPAPPAALVEHQTLKVAFAPPQPEVPALLPLPSQLPAVEPPEPPAAEDPKTLVPLVTYGPGSLACSCFRDMQPGDTPMMRNWNVLKLSSLLAVAVAVTPLPASATPPPGGPTEFGQGDIKELREAIDKKLDKLIEALTNSFAGVRVDLGKINDELKSLNKDNFETKLKLETALGRIEQLQKQVDKLREDLDKVPPKDKISLYPSEKGFDEIKQRLAQIEACLKGMSDGRMAFSSPAGAVGRIALANQYPEEILFTINGQAHRVPPFTTKNLENFPAGAFKYEVISPTYGLRGANTPTLEPGKTYTITVR